MTLADFYRKIKSNIKDNESLYKGFSIVGLSLPNFNRNKQGVYNNNIYVEAFNENLMIKLLIPLVVLKRAEDSGHSIGENVSVDIVINSVSFDTRGVLLVSISEIIETGVSEQEIFIRNLTQYCKDNNIFNRSKKAYPSIIKKIALISTNNTNTLDDILNNLDYKDETISFKVQSNSQTLAEQINKCNSDDFDLILLYRGGHTDKSMNIYSEIPVIEAINNSNVHIGTALGHDVDIPFIYNVADSTYSTPTNFAQRINEHNRIVKDDFDEVVNRIGFNIDGLKKRFEFILSAFNIDDIAPTINILQGNLRLLNQRINSYSEKILTASKNKVDFSVSKIVDNDTSLLYILKNKLNNRKSKIEEYFKELEIIHIKKRNKRIKIALTSSLLIAISVILYLIFK